MDTIWLPKLSKSAGPIYLEIVKVMEADIKAGHLAEGYRLPPQRELAYQLGVTHGTVTRAYKEAERRNLVRGETGRGTFIKATERALSPLIPSEKANEEELDLGRNFALPHLNPPLSQALETLSNEPDLDFLNNYVPSAGLQAHRVAAKRFLSKFYGINANEQEIIISCGAQHAVQTTILGLFNSGDMIAVDALTYPSLLNIIPHAGRRLLPIAMLENERGIPTVMDPTALDQACQTHVVRGVFFMPSVQNPTTHTMTKEEAEDLAGVCQKHSLIIIEDDPYTPFISASENRMPFFKYAPFQTVSIASISKLASPGIRIGYIRAPERYGRALKNAIGDSVWMASPVCAAIASYWINNGTLDLVVKEKSKILASRYQSACKILKRWQFAGGTQKPFIWLELPEHINAAKVEIECARHNVRILAAHHFHQAHHISGEHVPKGGGLRVSLATIKSEENFKRALQLLDEVLIRHDSSRTTEPLA
ncbi:PLP-dependent aminotransferase family protein [Polycladidibacter stylochi]|uniref:aminotransferase-like domain-containing protein n=1 Tax=Polycladidibacter stylochi TaxID=1807766 RepID=UPI000833F9CB|nr:PLP-dependent aminotransferase family protein [Pseudovibrio stylochi]